MKFEALNTEFEADVRSSFGKQQVMGWIGAQLTKVEPGVCEITLPYKAELTQQNGFLHAGIITTVADSACGYAAYSLMAAGSDVLSVEFKVNLMRPAKGLTFMAVAEVLKPGKTLTVVRADVFAVDEQAKQTMVATMLGTMMGMKKA